MRFIRKRCGLKEDVVTKVEKSMLRCFGHIERMSERRLTDSDLYGRCELKRRKGMP